MHYFTIENEKVIVNVTEALPPEIEKMYNIIREQYTIDYYLSDWADDDTDAGWGYDYDNSYGYKREPKREEMVLENGELAGFYVGYMRYDMVQQGYELTPQMIEKYYLPIVGDGKLYHNNYSTKRYSDSVSWELIAEENPKPSEYVYLQWVACDDREHIFTAEEFSAELIEDVVWKRYIEDRRGHFDDAFRVKLKIKPEVVKEPDKVLDALEKYKPILVRE